LTAAIRNGYASPKQFQNLRLRKERKNTQYAACTVNEEWEQTIEKKLL
jgi:hypothetical protein